MLAVEPLPEQRTIFAETLPKMLPGTVCQQMLRCGKPGCRCVHGELHGPYFYRFWRENGRLRKVYVPRSDLASVRQACNRRIRDRADYAKARELIAHLRAVACEAENPSNG